VFENSLQLQLKAVKHVSGGVRCVPHEGVATLDKLKNAVDEPGGGESCARSEGYPGLVGPELPVSWSSARRSRY